ncbi:uncharacterized protein LOC105437795 isoform X1 [Strongylocentrotus purpuratus]|uniref:C2H2-type domain-containing protein n=1 Tax=Strongylocentrotus purpuratus TaxID=7668 RepID=A0A7M7NW82_STRPU|nr:uncharacterized protein LOC105437795 isoform X1 [Strongylocentrotus purpuratus]
MYKCHHCHYRSNSPKNYSQHYTIHKYINNASFPCGVPGCTREFRVYESFTSHLSRDHVNYRVSCITDETSAPCSSQGDIGNLEEVGLEDELLDLTCTRCKMPCKEYNMLLSHLKEHIRNGDVVTCPFNDCTSEYRVVSSLTSHLYRIHPTLKCKPVIPISATGMDSSVLPPSLGGTSNDCNKDTEDIEMQQQLPEVEEDEPSDESLSSDMFLESVALFYLGLESKQHIPQSTLQKIITGVCNFHDVSQEQLQLQLKKHLEEEGIALDRIPIILNEVFSSDLFHLVNNSQSGPLRSNYCRKKFYTKHLNYISPVSVRLGRDGKNSERHYQYVPIRETVESFFQDPSVEKQYKMKQNAPSEIYEDFHCGEIFKEHELFGKDPEAVPIILYQDAFEVVNPLGSAKNKHKILAVYATFGNLLPQNRTKIEAMQLVLLCKEKDFKYFGMDVVFLRLVSDLQELEQNGVKIGCKNVPTSVLFILGDNLGSHCIGGFCQNFSSHPFICRFCLITHADFRENPLTNAELRTVDNYEEAIAHLETHLEKHEKPFKGIVSNSIFNRLRYFHVCSPGLPPCLGHDLFEGIVRYDLALYIKDLVKKKWFSYEYLNRTMKNAHLKGFDANDKPPEISSSGEKISGHAVQNWCLLRTLPFFLHAVIQDPEDQSWQLILRLREIVQFVCSQRISHGQVLTLRVLIDEYLIDRREAFPLIKLRPKHHFLRHYPELILKCGPLMRSWTMRFESKHSYFKSHARHCANFINITKSLAEKHQLLQAFCRHGQYFSVGISAERSVPFHSNLYATSVKSAVDKCGMHSGGDVHISDSVDIDGIHYMKGEYIIINQTVVDRFHLSFGLIQSFILGSDNSGTCHFLVSVIRSSYNPALGLYELLEASNQEALECNLRCLDRQQLLDTQPLHAYTVHRRNCIALKHSICV